LTTRKEESMTIPIFQVEAFTGEPFKGNPAAVCLLPGPGEEAWMQAVAREMNLSETAFLTPRQGEFDLRWFTPKVEVALCGHATLASAHVLWETGRLAPGETARFRTRSGLLTADRRGEEIELDFPATPDEPAGAPAGLLEALGTSARYVGRSRFDYLVEVDGESIVRGLKPDLGRLRAVEARGIMVTAASSAACFDFVSRFFAPSVGVDEDPVTGSAHCCLGPFWGRQLNKPEMNAYQASDRGGCLRVRVEGDRVRLGGRAVTILAGELLT